MSALFPLVGRQPQLADLTRRLDQARQGRGSVVLLSGEAGIGKSRLAEAAAERAAELEFKPTFGRCWEAGGAPAFWPWVQVFRALPSPARAQELSQASGLKACLAALLPTPDASATSSRSQLTPEEARFQLMDTAATALVNASQQQPLLVVLEDLHVGDSSSLSLLEFVESQARRARLLVIATFRPSDAARSRSAQRLSALCGRIPTLALSPLGRDAVGQYLSSGGGAPPSQEEIDHVFTMTEGHPLFVVEASRLRSERGPFEQGAPLPQGLLQTLDERLGRLSEPTRTALSCGALIGREFDVRDAQALTVEASSQRFEQALSDAVTAQLAVPVTSTRYRFSHILIREALVRSMPVAQQMELHRTHAERLALRANDAPELWFEVAHHYLESDATEATLQALERAAELALSQLAFDEAVELLEHALATARLSEPVNPHVDAELTLRLARARILAGDLEKGRQLCVAAADTAERLRDPQLLARAALLCGSVFLYADVDPVLVRLLGRALAALPEAEAATRVVVMARLAAAMQPAEKLSVPVKLAREALALARTLDDREVLLEVLHSAGSAMMDIVDAQERHALNREHLALAESLDNSAEAWRATCRLVVDCFELGQVQEARKRIDSLRARAAALNHPHYQWQALGFQAMEATFGGRFSQGEALWQSAAELGQRCRDPNCQRVVASGRLCIQRAQAAPRDQDIESHLKEAKRLFGDNEVIVQVEMGLLAQFGRGGDLPVRYWPVPDLEDPDPLVDVGSLGEVSWVAVATDSRPLAEHLLKHMARQSTRFAHGGISLMSWDTPVCRYEGMLLAFLGRDREALDAYCKALDLLDAAQGWSGLLICAAEYATCWQRSSCRAEHLDSVKGWLRRAEGIATQLGLDDWLEKLRALAEECGRADAKAVDRARPLRPETEEAIFSLEKEGDLWQLRYGSESFQLAHTKGLELLARLVAEPTREFHVLDLVSDRQRADPSSAGEHLDSTARDAYRTRIKALEEELAEASAFNDRGRSERLEEELAHLRNQLVAAFGLGGRARRAGDAAERARVNVRRRLKDALNRIQRHSPTLGRHVERSLSTGTCCSYCP